MSTLVKRTRVSAVSVASTGGLVVLSSRYTKGTVTIRQLDDDGREGRAYYVEALPHESADNEEFNRAVFPTLPTGNYGVSRPGATYTAKKVTIFPGQVTQADFR